MKSIPAGIDKYSKHFPAYMNNAEDLADYVLRIQREDGVSFNEMERRAERKGFQITQGYISKIVSRAAQNISIAKLRALAVALNRPEDEVFAVARGESLTAEKIQDTLLSSLLYDFQRLAKKDKEVLMPFLKALRNEIDERMPAPKE